MTKKPSPTKRTRIKALNKYGSTCWKCGSTQTPTVHHIKPKSLYPELKYNIDNLAILCRDCHIEYHKLYGIKSKIFKNWINK